MDKQKSSSWESFVPGHTLGALPTTGSLWLRECTTSGTILNWIGEFQSHPWTCVNGCSVASLLPHISQAVSSTQSFSVALVEANHTTSTAPLNVWWRERWLTDWLWPRKEHKAVGDCCRLLGTTTDSSMSHTAAAGDGRVDETTTRRTLEQVNDGRRDGD